MTLIIWVLPGLLLLFWLWMFWKMLNDDNLPSCYITLTNGNNVRFDWIFAFIFLSILTAGYYYFIAVRVQRR